MPTFNNVTLTGKANIYFDGKVISHGFTDSDGAKKSVGVIFKGSYNFGTAAAERMTVIAGKVTYRLAGEEDWQTCSAGQAFEVPGSSSFDISVDEGTAEYLCEYL